jgi:signal transduction histidine kinase
MTVDPKPPDVESLLREVAELERQIEAVRRIAVDLSTATETEDLVRGALDTSLALAGAEAGSILLYRPDTQKLAFEYVVGEKAKELTGVELEPGQGLAGVVFESGRTLVSEDVAAERAHLWEMGESLGYVTRNMVTVPLMSPETEPLGVMQVLNKREGQFDEHDVTLIETIAAQIAVAIKTVRLHEEARLAAVVRFIGNISHDVKNMITPPMTAAQTLRMVAERCFTEFDRRLAEGSAYGDSEIAGTMAELRKIYPMVVEMVVDGCDVVQQRTAQIAAAVKGVVSEPHFEPTDVASIAGRVGTMLRPQAERKGVELIVEEGSELPPAMVDGKQVYNAVYNLILNAIDACDRGEVVRFRCRGEEDGEGRRVVVLECSDTGPGIPPEVRAKLFTNAAVSTKPMGTGLGTKIIKDVVEAHRGTIEVESEVGVGTAIRCRIPVVRATSDPDRRT